MRRHATADTRLQIHLQNAGPMTVLNVAARDDLRRGEYFEFLRFSFHSGATIVIHERERSSTNREPPGSRSRHLGIKRNFLIVAWCRYGCACRLFSRKRVVLSRSRLVVLQNMRPKMSLFAGPRAARNTLCQHCRDTEDPMPLALTKPDLGHSSSHVLPKSCGGKPSSLCSK